MRDCIGLVAVVLCSITQARPVPGQEAMDRCTAKIDAQAIGQYRKLGGSAAVEARDRYGTWVNELDVRGNQGNRLDYLQAISFPTRFPRDAKLPPVEGPFALNFANSDVTDNDLKQLKHLENLTALNLRFTGITDVGLAALKDLKKLARLDLIGTKITDEGLKTLGELKELTSLTINVEKITDAGLKELQNFPNSPNSTLLARI